MNKNHNIIIINGRHYDSKTGESVSSQPQHTEARHVATRKPAGHAAAHPPKPSQTLMRQAVKKPQDSLKRHIKVQGQLSSSAERANSKIIARASARRPNTQRLQNPATKRSKGQLISHFSPDLFSVDSHTPAVTYGTTAVKSTAVHTAVRTVPAKKPLTTAELLDYAVQQASVPTHVVPAAPKRHRALFKRHVKQHARV